MSSKASHEERKMIFSKSELSARNTSHPPTFMLVLFNIISHEELSIQRSYHLSDTGTKLTSIFREGVTPLASMETTLRSFGNAFNFFPTHFGGACNIWSVPCGKRYSYILGGCNEALKKVPWTNRGHILRGLKYIGTHLPT
jgi:hypothetical protein